MDKETVDIKIPQDYQGNPVKIFVEKPRSKKDGPVSFISFSLSSDPYASELVIDQGKMITKEDAYQILREKGGLTDRIPCIYSLKEMRMISFDHNPSCYTGPRSFPFTWEGTECSFTSPFTVRVHNLDLKEAQLILVSIRKEFLKHWKPHIQPRNQTKIYTVQMIFGSRTQYQWKEHSSRVSRPLETIYLDERIKERLKETLKEFLGAEELYNRYGINWKKILLFFGPPGTGKSSTVLAMASHFNKSLARITIDPGMCASVIENLLATLPMDTFVLLEDVDALFVERQSQTQLDFSSLLNALDGVTTRQGLVLFITTNHLEKLDQALMRPGRVDELIHFPPPTREIFQKALASLAPEWWQEHKVFLDDIEEHSSFTLASLQKHLFHCVMKKNESILIPKEEWHVFDRQSDGRTKTTLH